MNFVYKNIDSYRNFDGKLLSSWAVSSAHFTYPDSELVSFVSTPDPSKSWTCLNRLDGNCVNLKQK